jgi:hypothetical protein
MNKKNELQKLLHNPHKNIMTAALQQKSNLFKMHESTKNPNTMHS